MVQAMVQRELNPNTEIQPLIGSKEGILHVTLAFVNPGEQVLVPNRLPTYTSLSNILGAEVVTYNLKEENGWMPDFEEFRSYGFNPREVDVDNYPNMPTGANATPEHMKSWSTLPAGRALSLSMITRTVLY